MRMTRKNWYTRRGTCPTATVYQSSQISHGMGRDWGRPQRREDGEERPEPWHDSEAPPECGNTFPSNAPPISEIALFWRFPHFARLSFWYDSVNMKMDMHIWWNDTESKRVEHPCTRKKKPQCLFGHHRSDRDQQAIEPGSQQWQAGD